MSVKGVDCGLWIMYKYINLARPAIHRHASGVSVVTLIRKPPLFSDRPKQGGGFLLKDQKYPKIFGAFGADFRLFIVEIYTQTIVFELTSAAGEKFDHFCTLFERFYSKKR